MKFKMVQLGILALGAFPIMSLWARNLKKVELIASRPFVQELKPGQSTVVADLSGDPSFCKQWVYDVLVDVYVNNFADTGKVQLSLGDSYQMTANVIETIPDTPPATLLPGVSFLPDASKAVVCDQFTKITIKNTGKVSVFYGGGATYLGSVDGPPLVAKSQMYVCGDKKVKGVQSCDADIETFNIALQERLENSHCQFWKNWKTYSNYAPDGFTLLSQGVRVSGDCVGKFNATVIKIVGP